MRPLPPSELLGLWERGRFQHPAERALTLLEAARPDASRDVLAESMLGERDHELLALRRATFGDCIRAESDCPECAARVEVEIDAAALLRSMEPAATAGAEVEIGSYRVAFRPIKSLDLLAIAELEDVDKARDELVRRCVIEAFDDDGPLEGDLPAEVVRELAHEVERCDPASETLLQMACPVCDREWSKALDIASFLWAEIVSAAEEVLFDVDLLARAYGWPESAVLALSAARRAWYVGAVS